LRLLNSATLNSDVGQVPQYMEDRAKLTVRQKDCVRLVSDGYTSKQIAQFLSISPSTVDNHIRSALRVLDVETRAEAARALKRLETSQRLTSQPQSIAHIEFYTQSSSPTAAKSAENPHPTKAWAVVPVGGVQNNLNVGGRTIAILQVAGISLMALLGLSILLAGALHVFS
jgi:DNA-binding CsgD family transcriptional regulator